MASDDLNECVDALLEKRSKAAFKQHADAISKAKKASEEESKDKNRKSVAKPLIIEGKTASVSAAMIQQDKVGNIGAQANKKFGKSSLVTKDGETVSVPRVIIRTRQ